LRLPEIPARVGRAVAALSGLLLALVLHRQLLGGLTTTLPGEPGSDVLRALWSAWLVGEEFPGWPFGTTVAGFPEGVDLLPFPAVSLVLAAPFARLIGPVFAVDLIVLAHTVFAVLATAGLVRTLGGRWGAAVLAGVLVATQPVLGGALRDGTLEVLAVGWVPLTMLCMVRACRGEWRWGLGAGLAFLATCLESVYYGSFTALGVLAILSTLRSRDGLRGAALAGLTVALGLGLTAAAFWPVIEQARAATESAGDSADLRSLNAIDLTLLQELSLSPGSRGWRVGDIWAPPVPHLVAMLVGVAMALRRSPWLSVLALLYFGLALHHPALSLWSEGPIGEVVRFPRRYLAPMAVVSCAGLWWGSSLVPRRFEVLELLGGLALAAWLGWWGAAAGGLSGEVYPALELPIPSFVAHLAEDDEPGAAVLFLPTEIPGTRTSELRSELPVYADLDAAYASGDLPALQALADKSGWTAPQLVTLARRDGEDVQLAKNLTDLCFPHFGLTAGGATRLPPEAYTEELAWLEGQGLKYVVVDRERYEPLERDQVDAILSLASVTITDFEDGSGVRVYQLYEERPEPAARPTGQGVGAGFGGKVQSSRHLLGVVRVVVTSGGKRSTCMVTPDDRSFQCGALSSVDQVQLFVGDEEVPVERSGGYTDAVLTVVDP
jgi:hypothetical protein